MLVDTFSPISTLSVNVFWRGDTVRVSPFISEVWLRFTVSPLKLLPEESLPDRFFRVGLSFSTLGEVLRVGDKDGGGGGWTRMLGGCSSTIPFFLVLTMGLSLRLSSLLSAALDGCSVSVNSGCSLVARRLEIRLVCSFWCGGAFCQRKNTCSSTQKAENH